MTHTEKANISKLILGTAQFGLNYGISNQQGQIQSEEVTAILIEAAKAGITTLDTAAAYGESEDILGNVLSRTNLSFRIISKYPPNQPELNIKEAFNASIAKLDAENIYGYLLHSFSSYAGNKAVLKKLLELKAAGLVKQIGVSLYHPEEAEQLLSDKAAVDIVQFPYSVFDRRFEQVMPKLRQQGIETHVRSVYLQGLYFMNIDDLPTRLSAAAPKVRKLQLLAKQHDTPLAAMLLAFTLTNSDITNIVIGVENLQTLQENISYCSTGLSKELLEELQQFAEEDENIILPYKWPKR